MITIDGVNERGESVRVVVDGSTFRAVYADALVDTLETLGTVEVRRASHVEPVAGGGWAADMGPVGGPVLGGFRTRQEALAAEVGWLRSEMGL